MSGKLAAAARMLSTEIDRSRRGFGLGEEVVREPMGWPRFVGNVSVSLLWSLLRVAAVFILLSALTWAANAALSVIVGGQQGGPPPVWMLMAFLATMYLVVGLIFSVGLDRAVGTTTRRAVGRSVVAFAVVGISIFAASKGWPLWAAYLVVFAAVLGHRALRYMF
jgi:hypothetical protein